MKKSEEEEWVWEAESTEDKETEVKEEEGVNVPEEEPNLTKETHAALADHVANQDWLIWYEEK